MKWILFSVVFAVQASCGSIEAGSGSIEHEDKSESYSYEYEVNGCKTGKHNFSSKKDYCAALLNEELNKGCAFRLRTQKHKQEC